MPYSNSDALNFLDPPVSTSFYLLLTTTAEIEDEISNLNQSKSTGPFSIPIYLLKVLKRRLSAPLEIIYNFCCMPLTMAGNYHIAQNWMSVRTASERAMSNQSRDI